MQELTENKKNMYFFYFIRIQLDEKFLNYWEKDKANKVSAVTLQLFCS